MDAASQSAPSMELSNASVNAHATSAADEVDANANDSETTALTPATPKPSPVVSGSPITRRAFWTGATLFAVATVTICIAVPLALHNASGSAPPPAVVLAPVCSPVFLKYGPGANPQLTCCVDFSAQPGMFSAAALTRKQPIISELPPGVTSTATLNYATLVLPDGSVLVTVSDCSLVALGPPSRTHAQARKCVMSRCDNASDPRYSVPVWSSVLWRRNVSSPIALDMPAFGQCPRLQGQQLRTNASHTVVRVWWEISYYSTAALVVNVLLSLDVACGVFGDACVAGEPTQRDISWDPRVTRWFFVPAPVAPDDSQAAVWWASGSSAANVTLMVTDANGMSNVSESSDVVWSLPTDVAIGMIELSSPVALHEGGSSEIWMLLQTHEPVNGMYHWLGVLPYSSPSRADGAVVQLATINATTLVRQKRLSAAYDVIQQAMLAIAVAIVDVTFLYVPYLQCLRLNGSLTADGTTAAACDEWNRSALALSSGVKSATKQACLAIGDWCIVNNTAVGAAGCSTVYASFSTVSGPRTLVNVVAVNGSNGAMMQQWTSSSMQLALSCPVLAKHGIASGQHALLIALANNAVIMLDAANIGSGPAWSGTYSLAIPAEAPMSVSTFQEYTQLTSDGSIVVGDLRNGFFNSGERATVALAELQESPAD